MMLIDKMQNAAIRPTRVPRFDALARLPTLSSIIWCRAPNSIDSFRFGLETNLARFFRFGRHGGFLSAGNAGVKRGLDRRTSHSRAAVAVPRCCPLGLSVHRPRPSPPLSASLRPEPLHRPCRTVSPPVSSVPRRPVARRLADRAAVGMFEIFFTGYRRLLRRCIHACQWIAVQPILSGELTFSAWVQRSHLLPESFNRQRAAASEVFRVFVAT